MEASVGRSFPVANRAARSLRTKRYVVALGCTRWWLPPQLPRPRAWGSPSRGVPSCHRPAHFERPHATADCVSTQGTVRGGRNTKGRSRARRHRA
eukprot:5482653-Pleurochrysis_carterae.AAC.1